MRDMVQQKATSPTHQVSEGWCLINSPTLFLQSIGFFVPVWRHKKFDGLLPLQPLEQINFLWRVCLESMKKGNYLFVYASPSIQLCSKKKYVKLVLEPIYARGESIQALLWCWQ